MKSLKVLLLICCCFSSVNLFAQTPKLIEANLVKSFKKINDWSTDTVASSKDSLWNAKKNVGKKLYNYVTKYPSTMSYPFKLLEKQNVDISTSDDDKFRIYSWDTWTGGTMHFFESVFQYKAKNKTLAVLDTEKKEGDSLVDYWKLYTIRVGGKTYYAATYLFIESSRYYGEGIQIFSIDQSKLINDNKIIKTQTGLHSQIDYEVDLSATKRNWEIQPRIHYNSASKTIYIPLIKENGTATYKYITYKFTGKYFEKVKS